MTDEHMKFKAPQLPNAPHSAPATDFSKPAVATVAPVPANNVKAASNSQKVNYDNNFAADFNLPPKILQTKFIAVIAGCILLFGMLFGCMMAPTPQVRQTGLGDFVLNQAVLDYPVPRCGQVDVGQACVLYIMNAKKRDQLGKDFFQQAANMTGVQEYTIRINNVAYAEKLIRPGFIAQIYIPKR